MNLLWITWQTGCFFIPKQRARIFVFLSIFRARRPEFFFFIHIVRLAYIPPVVNSLPNYKFYSLKKEKGNGKVF